MIAKLFLGGAITAAAINTATPAAADPGNPFNYLCMDSHRSTSAPATFSHSGISQVQAGIQDGLRDMQSALSPSRRPPS
jgi:hypothetical protein